MAFQSGPGGEGQPLAEINVTPLVDVMLVLLIVFMVAAPMMVVGVPVDLPRTAAPRAAAPSPPIVLTVARDGRLFLRQDPIDEAALATTLRPLLARLEPHVKALMPVDDQTAEMPQGDGAVALATYE